MSILYYTKYTKSMILLDLIVNSVYNMHMSEFNLRLNPKIIARRYANNARAREKNTYKTDEQRKYAVYLNHVKRMQKAIATGAEPDSYFINRAIQDGYIEKVGDDWAIVKDIRTIFPRDIIKSMEVIVWH